MLKIIILIVSSIYFIQCWEALPQIPTGRRSQYLVLHESGGYKYGYDTGDGSAAEQSGDASNQVEGRYLYDGPSGQKLSIKYTAGVQGFVPEGIPQGSLIPASPAVPIVTQYSNTAQDNDDQAGTGDASYAFNIDTDSYKRQESSDARGNVKGSYSYNNGAGTHDLTYLAGENTGFVAVSGSLATPNGIGSSSSPQGYTYNPPVARSSSSSSFQSSSSTPNADGSYSFGYSTPDASQEQSGDTNGNIKGSYSYRNSAGLHDLTYIAGSETGFVATGGSLSQPNGLPTQSADTVPNPQISPSGRSQDAYPSFSSALEDGSYRFEYSTDDSSRKETGDAGGNVQGSYSYRNQAGTHDLSYIAGSSTGFQVTGGSLSVPNGLGSSNPNILTPSFYNNPQAASWPSTYSSPEQSDLANTGDSSYSFTVDTDDYKRTETSDANGNVQGSFSYRNGAGTHDLSFVAGSATGFLPTGGSLSNPNTIPASSLRSSPALPSSNDNEQGTGDASYNFSIDTDEYKRTESSDANGNVIGSFSYKNSLGQHDLSYNAGAEKGFRTTGGSLSIPPGLSETQLRSAGFNSQSTYASVPVTSYSSDVIPVLPSTKNTYRIGNVVVNSYLPPSNEKRKFGYIFDTKY